MKLYEDAYFLVERLGDEPIVRARRTEAPFESIEAAQRSFQRIEEAVARAPIALDALLLDLRIGPGRNDVEFESLIGRVRERLFAPFAHRATVLRTATGLLQSRRIERETKGPGAALFDDYDEALAFLRAALAR